MELNLLESEERYRSLVEVSPDGILVHDGTVILFANPSALRLLGYSPPQDIVGRPVMSIIHPDARPVVASRIDLISKGTPRPPLLELKFLRSDGSAVDVENSPAAIVFEGRNAIQVIVRDITERKAAERVLAQAREAAEKWAEERIISYQLRLRRMTSELALAEEETKRRIAKDLHDQIGQALAFCQIRLGAIRHTISDSMAGQLDEVRRSLGEIIKSTRSLTFELSSPVLYELGLQAAIERLLETLQRDHALSTTFNDDGQSKEFSDDIRVTLYMAARELLTNVVKHARATNVSVSIAREEDRVRIVVEDNGAGFDASQIATLASDTGGFGLFSTRERLEYLGGSMVVNSTPGTGTVVTIVAPVKTTPGAGKR
jgi:PAS domain S-box-containing protein